MTTRVEVWIDCDLCPNQIGPTLTETTARNIAIRAGWLPLKHLRDGLEISSHWCPDCRKAGRA